METKINNLNLTSYDPPMCKPPSDLKFSGQKQPQFPYHSLLQAPVSQPRPTKTEQKVHTKNNQPIEENANSLIEEPNKRTKSLRTSLFITI